MDTKQLESLLADAMPAMDGLKRIAAEDWSIDMPGDCGWSFLGREDNSPRIIVIERGFGLSADARHSAIESLCTLAPALAREVIELRRKVAEMTIDIAARDAALAGAVKVKPLAWQEKAGESYRQANSAIGMYQVSWLGELESWQLYCPGSQGRDWRENFSWHSSSAEAKVAAKADYEARILSAIEPAADGAAR